METTATTIQSADGRSLCVESGGDPAGFPILVHNGTPGSRHLSAPSLLDAEERGVHLISYDRPGYGRSTAQPGRTVASCAADVQTIADAFGIARLAVWGHSGGGPHAVACAALLPDLVSAVATLASIAPYGVEGLDWFGGMGKDNVDDTRLFLDDREAARKKLQQDRLDMLGVTPDGFHELLQTLISPVDAKALTLEVAEDVVRSVRTGLEFGDEGWWEDTCAHMAPWGFDLEAIETPVQVRHGAQDRFVPFQHGQWLAAHIPNADAHLTEVDGHVTLAATRVPEVHAWLLEHV